MTHTGEFINDASATVCYSFSSASFKKNTLKPSSLFLISGEMPVVDCLL